MAGAAPVSVEGAGGDAGCGTEKSTACVLLAGFGEAGGLRLLPAAPLLRALLAGLPERGMGGGR